MEHRTQRFASFRDDEKIPVTSKKEDIMLVIAGGPGKHSMFLPTRGNSFAVTKPIR
jgi:hypothetical protein